MALSHSKYIKKHIGSICLCYVNSKSILTENLEKIYFTYIRPLLEYAFELWDGCTILDLNKIEQIQHEAARMVTGLPKFASIESLYFEGHSRRHSRKLNLFYKIRNIDSPLYL
jgi:hypothetical protein